MGVSKRRGAIHSHYHRFPGSIASLPLVGRDRGWGEPKLRVRTPPTPIPSPQGGGRRAGEITRYGSLRDLCLIVVPLSPFPTSYPPGFLSAASPPSTSLTPPPHFPGRRAGAPPLKWSGAIGPGSSPGKSKERSCAKKTYPRPHHPPAYSPHPSANGEAQYAVPRRLAAGLDADKVDTCISPCRQVLGVGGSPGAPGLTA